MVLLQSDQLPSLADVDPLVALHDFVNPAIFQTIKPVRGNGLCPYLVPRFLMPGASRTATGIGLPRPIDDIYKQTFRSVIYQALAGGRPDKLPRS
jgi:hypothetical protein